MFFIDRFKVISFFIWLSIFVAGPFSTAYALEILVKDQAAVQGDIISLDLVASFNPADDHRVERLSETVISSAPSPGNSFRLDNRFLIYKIGSVISGEKDIMLRVPETLLVQRSAQYVNQEKLNQIFRDYVKSKTPWDADIITFDRINTPVSVALPEGVLSWKVSERGNRNYVGNVSLTIDFSVDNIQVKKISVSGYVRVRREFVTALRAIKSGELITEDDLALVSKDSEYPHRDAIAEISKVAGMRASRSMQDGQIITSSMIEVLPLIIKGENVVVKAENDAVRITTQGKVLEDGMKGDQIRVVNIGSGKELLARVAGPGLVEVSF
ncbi:MAG: flagellar basal body P-ring formation protein FlgA [Deltaproteobacteria bacterium]|nr:flagellar basal body P-ring formation protein FlgA [Deltaproteobacteria bacterium]